MEKVELTAHQRRMLIHHRVYPGDSSLNLVHVERVRGDVDLEALAAAYEHVLSESTIPNLVFSESDDFCAYSAQDRVAKVPVLDVPEHATKDEEARYVADQAGKLADTPFEITTWPLYQVSLHRGRWAFYARFVFSHLIADAVTLYNITEMAVSIYNGEGLTPKHREGMRDVSVEETSPRRIESSLEHFRSMLSDSSEITHPVLSSQRDSMGRIHGVSEQIRLPEELSLALGTSELINKFGPYVLFTAAQAILLSSLSSQSQITLGIPLSTRRNWRQMHQLGHHINVVPLVLHVTGEQSFAELCQTIAVKIKGLLRNKSVVLDEYASSIFPGRSISFQPDNTITYYQRAFPLDIEGSENDSLPVPREFTRYPLSVNVRYAPSGFIMDVEYALQLKSAQPAQLLQNVLDQAIHSPHSQVRDVSPLPVDMESRIDELINLKHDPQGSDLTIDEAFRSAVSTHPDRPAVSDQDGTWSYKELDERVEGLASGLDRSGHERHVLVSLDPGKELIAVLLAVLRSGRAYVPIEPTAPEARVNRILESFHRLSVVAGPDHLPQVGGTVRSTPEDLLSSSGPGIDRVVPSSSSPAYVIFTSGSTGAPKGVEVTHHNVSRLFSATRKIVEPTADDIWCLFHSYAFDFSVWEIFGALLHGGRLVIPEADTTRSPEAFLSFLEEEGITVLNQTPAAFRRLLGLLRPEHSKTLALRSVVFGGEALYPSMLKPWFAVMDRSVHMVNMYGITETTVHATHHEVDPEQAEVEKDSVIGSPLPDLRISVVDHHLRRCPVGVPGEIVISGPGLAQGYLNRPEATAERFPEGTHLGERVYRSGDRGAVRSDGTLVYLGRMDNQVQVRGYRVETGEVEAALLQCSSITSAHVALHLPDGKEPSLAAWFTPPSADPTELRVELGRHLPAYMLPTHFVPIDEIPLTLNGKVDAKALPEPVIPEATPTPKAGGAAARVAAIWGEAIGIGTITADANPFDFGGTSMHVVEVHRRLLDEFTGTDMTVAEIFEYPTPRMLAQRLVGTNGDKARPQRMSTRSGSASRRRSRMAARRLPSEDTQPTDTPPGPAESPSVGGNRP